MCYIHKLWLIIATPSLIYWRKKKRKEEFWRWNHWIIFGGGYYVNIHKEFGLKQKKKIYKKIAIMTYLEPYRTLLTLTYFNQWSYRIFLIPSFKEQTSTYLIFIKYCANATESGLPLIVIVRSVLPPSRSSQFDMRIIAPEMWRISAIFVPPLPMIHPIKSFGTVISCCCWLDCCCGCPRDWLFDRSCEPASAAKAKRT